MVETDVVTSSPGRAALLATTMLVRIGEAVNRTLVLPVVIFFPTSRCNSRCVSCDWWKSSGADDLTLPEVASLARSLPALGTRVVAFTGGEPLLRPDVFDVARAFRAEGLRLHLLTSGVLLERCADEVARHVERVIVSLDAADERLYQRIRGVPGLPLVEKGVAALRRRAPALPVTARATIHRMNFRELVALIDHARAMALDGISFLPADVTSSAFNRTHGVQPSDLTLTSSETAEFAGIVEEAIASRPDAFASGFVAESPDRLRRLPQYYAAMNGQAPLPEVACNAPWMSVVIEADGAVRPCFFHEAIGNIRTTPLASIVGGALPAFRSQLEVPANPVCRRCVCSIRYRMAGDTVAVREQAWPALEDTRAAFDRVAAGYDRSNTENPILSAMRRSTLDALTSRVAAGSRILDLGCGPGGDAETLGRAGHTVTALDWSPAMVEEAQRRVRRAQLWDRVEVRHLGIQEIDHLDVAAYDAALSNFGPLNCVPDLDEAARLIAARLRPGGWLVASVIGRVCPWEIGLYLSRGNLSRARVRFSKQFVPVPLDGRIVWTRYYSPARFTRVFSRAGFRSVALRSLGLFAPPPYLEAFARRHRRVVEVLQTIDEAVAAWPVMRGLGDHFLVVLVKR